MILSLLCLCPSDSQLPWDLYISFPFQLPNKGLSAQLVPVTCKVAHAWSQRSKNRKEEAEEKKKKKNTYLILVPKNLWEGRTRTELPAWHSPGQLHGLPPPTPPSSPRLQEKKKTKDTKQVFKTHADEEQSEALKALVR